jgi:hypothetical protein
MNKYFIAPIFAFAFFSLLTTQISAVDFGKYPGTSSAINNSQLNGVVRQKLEQKKGELRERIASQTAQFRDKRKGLIKERLTHVLNILSGNLQRLSFISDKIQVRINKIKDKGIDTTAMQSALDGCGVNKTALAAAITDATAKVSAITDNGQADGSAKAALQSVKLAYESTRSYKKCLISVVSTIRASMSREGTSGAN